MRGTVQPVRRASLTARDVLMADLDIPVVSLEESSLETEVSGSFACGDPAAGFHAWTGDAEAPQNRCVR